MADQTTFERCYRGRQTSLHHAAYMRMAKVLLALHICRKAGISLQHKSIFDYGFGAGTFFRYCPGSSRLAGVEIDPVNVEEVKHMLRDRGFSNIDLRPIANEHWSEHPLLEQQYDIILCRHVLEHLPDLVEFLCKIKACLSPGGKFVGLVPLNERKPDFYHVQAVDKQKVENWATAANMRVVAYIETDHWLYWIQPWLIYERALAHKFAQAVSLLLGIPCTLIGNSGSVCAKKGRVRLNGFRFGTMTIQSIPTLISAGVVLISS